MTSDEKSKIQKTKLTNILKDKLQIEGNNENKIQKLFESNPELIPLPFLLNHRLHLKSVLKKLELPNGRITDFSYLTKSTVRWEAVHIELESSNKNIFTNSAKKIVFSQDFNNAYDQITSWKAYLLENKEIFKKSIGPLLGNLASNPLKFKFVLIIGRNSDLSSQEKKDMFNEKNNEDIQVMTYDSVINHLENNPITKKTILSKTVSGYKIINLNDVDTTLISALPKDNLEFDDKIRSELIKKKYNIVEWEKNIGNIDDGDGSFIPRDFKFNEILKKN